MSERVPSLAPREQGVPTPAAVCAVSVDLDPLRCYYAIHGLGEVPGALRDVVLRRALPRFAQVFAQHRIPSTLFVVGSDVQERGAAGRAELEQLARDGHELGNHSHTHPYALARFGEPEIDRELAQAEEVLGEIYRAAGPDAGPAPGLEGRVVGFRSPGYDLSASLLAVLRRRGYAYDSSIFPSWPYYAAKAGVLGVMSLLGRSSQSVLGDPRALLAPVVPYRPGRSPFSRGEGPLVELPISVTPGLRLPAIGTTLLTAPATVRLFLLRQVRARTFFNFELHGLDLIDAEADGIPAELVARQPDLRVPLAEKLRAFSATIDKLRLDYRFATLAEVARLAPLA